MASGIGGDGANLATGTYPNDRKVKDLEHNYAEKGLDARTHDLAMFDELAAAEAHHDIKFRTMSWQKAAILLFGEYVCLAILALAWSWSVLGWVGGCLFTFGLGLMTWYTSYVLWEYCMRHPEVRDICDIGYLLFGGSKIAYELTAIMLLLNNIFLMGFHVFTGSKILNTLSTHSQCTVVFTAVITIMSIVVSLPRTLKHVAFLSIPSAVSMAIAILLTLIFAGIEDHPGYGYAGNWPTAGAQVVTTVGAMPSTFINGFNAALNITFLFVGQILYPSFIAEMERPQDFPKALAALTGMELILFMVTSAVGYFYMGQYSTAPLVGSLSQPWARKAAFAFVLPPTLIIGSIYSNVAAKYLYKRVLGNSRHSHSHTVVGWGVWISLVIAIWCVAFVLGDVIPSMGDFLSIMSAAFDSFFGFIFWAMAYFSLKRDRLWKGAYNTTLTLFNIFILICGLFMLGPGLYTSIQAIQLDYAGSVRQPFTCADNSL